MRINQAPGAWDVVRGASHRFHEKFSLPGGVGVAGLRDVTITRTDSDGRFESQPGVVFSLAIQFRP